MQIHVVTAKGKSILTLNKEDIPLGISERWGRGVFNRADLTKDERAFLAAICRSVGQAREDEPHCSSSSMQTQVAVNSLEHLHKKILGALNTSSYYLSYSSTASKGRLAQIKHHIELALWTLEATVKETLTEDGQTAFWLKVNGEGK